MVTVSRDDAEIPVLLVHPDDSDTAMAGILLIHDIWGSNDFYHDVARRLAGEGYVVALPNLFHREGPLPEDTRDAAMARGARVNQRDQLDDLEAVTTWLKRHERCSGAYGLIGFCMGGTLTFLRSARNPTADAAVAFYGFPAKDATENAPIRPMDESELAAIDSPLLGIWGDRDAGVGMDNVDAYGDALVRHGKPHDFIVYPDIGHGFLTFDEGAAGYETSVHAWRKTLMFLKSHLNQATAAS
jgi:carboxymethylenebutenolidase